MSFIYMLTNVFYLRKLSVEFVGICFIMYIRYNKTFIILVVPFIV